MRVLLLGGTGWLGRRLAEAATRSGHEVTCVARGTDTPSRAGLVRADRDHEDALTVLPAIRWGAVIDVAPEPGHVRRTVRDLGSHADRYVFVSSCNVYASLADEGIDQDTPLHDPLATDAMASPRDYGPAKVAG